MKYYILFYEAGPDYVEQRASYRAEHLELARRATADGSLLMGGAYAPADGAALIFRGETDAAATAFARNDPYVKNGLVSRWYVREWTVVVGG